ncbi:MAG TPA: hypothetical protein VK900_10005 [Anaerolineales bacterium]|nr:hypothetical protein [Anaerolineales bacterium]
MKSKFFVFFTLTLMIILNACAPIIPATSSGEQPTPEVEVLPATEVPVTGYQPVAVDQVQVEVGLGSPIPVQVTVTGNLPDTCAQIELVQQKQEGSHFEITMSTVPSNVEGCVRDTLPFRIEIPLNITNLPAGSYTVAVNGVGADFQLETGNTTSSQPDADTVIRKDDIEVPSVNVEIGVGSPIPVHAIVAVNLPDSCAQLGEIRLHREGNTFYVRLIADIAERADCREDSIPFVLKVPLNIVNLPEGPYEVNVNGTTASFDPRATPAAPASLEDFESQLQAALTQRDAEGMRALMGERFIVAYWQSEGESIPSEEAVTQLLNSHVAENSALEFREFQDIPAFDAQSFVGPDVELAKAIYVTGWSADGQQDALLFVSRRPEGSLFWQGVLVTPKGFAPPETSMGQSCSEPEAVPVVNGQASYNGISFKIDPSLDYGLTARICSATTAEEQQMVNEAHPPYTEFFFPTFSRQNVDYQPSIRVYEVTGDLESYLFPINSLDELQATLEARPQPITWLQNAPLHTHEAYLDFASGAGVRGLIQYMQDFFFFTNNGLIYEFQGLTQDGRHYVNVRYPVSVPFLMELEGFTLPPNNINPQALAIGEWTEDHEQQRRVIETYNAEALQRFELMSDSEVFPNLALLDQMVQSIAVSQP